MSIKLCKIISLLFIFLLLSSAIVLANNLLDAINKGDVNEVKNLISNGVNINEKIGGITPLIYASISGHKEIVELLLSEGADINLKDDNDGDGGRTPLMHATLLGRKEIVELLISKGADIKSKSHQGGQTALMYALGNGQQEIARLLISKPIDDIRDNYGNNSLMYALNNEQLEVAKIMISNGANINAENNYGGTALIIASSGWQKEIVKLLIEKGADIKHKDHHGTTAFLSSILNNRIELSNFLLSKGADISDINIKGEGGRTPLMNASWYGHKQVVEFLILKGANVNERDYDGRTPIMYTALYGVKNMAVDAEGKIPSQYYVELASRKEVAELLIVNGADINMRDYDGRTALTYAAMNGLEGISELLISEGAKRPVEKIKDIPFKANDKELQEAKEALINFFDYLHDGQYEKAVLLFEPWAEGEGRHQSSWEAMFSFLLSEERNEKGKAKGLGIQYRTVGVPIRAKVLDIQKVDNNLVRLKIQFIQDDGSVYVYGPCCGASEETMPSENEFVYFVERLDGGYKVRTPPLFRP